MTTQVLDAPETSDASNARTFIRVTEIWVPSSDGTELVWQDGAYGELGSFEKHSKHVHFGFGEGLPGKAWKEKRPVVLKDFEGSYFMRTAEAHEAGLTSAIAFPIFSGEFIRAVIVFLCGDTEELAGAIEIWRANDVDTLCFDDGYFGDLDRFEHMTRTIQFPRGTGLPGNVWKSGYPILVGDLSDSSSFLRTKYATEAGIGVGVGIPFYAKGSPGTVVTFLSSKSTPIARRFEIWRLDESRSTLALESFIGRDADSVTYPESEATAEFGEGPIGRCWKTGLPVLEAGNPEDDYQSLLAIPLIKDGALNSVIVCHN